MSKLKEYLELRRKAKYNNRVVDVAVMLAKTPNISFKSILEIGEEARRQLK